MVRASNNRRTCLTSLEEHIGYLAGQELSAYMLKTSYLEVIQVLLQGDRIMDFAVGAVNKLCCKRLHISNDAAISKMLVIRIIEHGRYRCVKRVEISTAHTNIENNSSTCCAP